MKTNPFSIEVSTLCSSFVFGIVCFWFVSPVHSENRKTTGEFTGVYYQDRRGGGHFGEDYVDPKLHETLKDYNGNRIRVKVKRTFANDTEGPLIIEEIGDITELDPAPLGMTFSLKPVVSETASHELTCFYVNQSKESIHVSLQSLWMKISCPVKVTDAEQPSWFPGYTRGQLAVQNLTPRWHNTYLVEIPQTTENRPLGLGHRLHIEPGQRFPVVTRLKLPTDEIDFHARYVGAVAGKPKYSNSYRFQLDADEFVEERQSESLLVTSVNRKPTRGRWEEWEFTIQPKKGEERSIVTCQMDDGTYWIAGLISATDKDGQNNPLSVKEKSGSDNIWELATVPAEGYRIRMQLMNSWFAKRFNLRVLSDRGLESLIFDAPQRK